MVNDLKNKPVRQSQLRISKGLYSKSIIKSFFKVLMSVFGAVVLIYFCFAFTLMRFLPTTDFKAIPVKNITYSGGIVPVGSEIVVDVSGNTYGKGFIDRVKQTFIASKGTSVVTVEAGPNGKLKWDKPGLISVDGKVLDTFLPDVDGESPIDEKDPYLRNQYIVNCVEGACVEGQAYIVSADSILGEPLVSYGTEDGE